MNDRMVDRAVPVGRLLRSSFVRPDQRRCKCQLLLQRRTHLLVSLQAPPFSNRTTPVPIPRVLAVADLQAHPPDDASESHHALSPVSHFSLAEGGKLRLGGLLLPGAFAPVVVASIRDLLVKLPTLFRAESAADYCPRSLVLSYG